MSATHPSALPIKIDATSNGEFQPIPVGSTVSAAKAQARSQVTENARRLGLPRRAFLSGLCGAATTLLTLNAAFAARGNTGGLFRLPREAALDQAAAAETLAGNDFIFDVQTHMVDPAAAWRRNRGRYWEEILTQFPQGSCGESDPVDCFSADRFIKEVFLDSDTDVAVLSFVPELPERNPTTMKEAQRTRLLVDALEGAHRLLLHGMVVPNAQGVEGYDPLAAMEQAAADFLIAAWKVYTQWGPEGTGWALDDPRVGIPFIEKARALGINRICIHKGLSFPGFPPEFANCADVGRAARLYPDVTFLIYHSGFEVDRREGPFDPNNAERGVDSLIKSLLDNDVPPNSNVYAELGSTWRFVMRDPTTAAHTLGKLLKHVGEDRVLWGTDSIWYGSPQDQIQAFRAFQIADELIGREGYPPLTPEIKAKVFGLSAAPVYGIDPAAHRRRAALDPVSRRKAAYREEPAPSFATYGPRTRAEYLALQAEREGLPA